MWLNLRPYLPTGEANGDEWAAEALLAKRLADAGVFMSSGERYQSEKPGRFRMIFTYDEDTLREGIRRSVPPIRVHERTDNL